MLRTECGGGERGGAVPTSILGTAGGDGRRDGQHERRQPRIGAVGAGAAAGGGKRNAGVVVVQVRVNSQKAF